jgi:hypothetical protein
MALIAAPIVIFGVRLAGAAPARNAAARAPASVEALP